MFLEPHIEKSASSKRPGWIEVICGSMFSGKTEELIRRLNRSILARQRVEIFKPSIDTRYHEKNVVSHNENEIRCTPVQFAEDITLLSGDCDVVGIDEGQFFDEELVEEHLKTLREEKKEEEPAEAPRPTPHMGGCPGSRSMTFDSAEDSAVESGTRKSKLAQWPIQ